MPTDVTEVVHIDHCEAVRIDRDDVKIVSVVGSPVRKSSVPLLPENRLSDIGDHPHFMHKEISEQAAAVQGAMKGRVDFNKRTIEISELREIRPDSGPRGVRRHGNVIFRGHGRGALVRTLGWGTGSRRIRR